MNYKGVDEVLTALLLIGNQNIANSRGGQNEKKQYFNTKLIL
jgi:hypothetical protein